MSDGTKRTGSLTYRVILVLILAVVLPTVTVGVIATWRARTNLEREVSDGHLALIRAVGAQLDGTLQDARRTLELAAAGWADNRVGDEVIANDAQTLRLLGRLRREVGLFSELSIVDVDGKTIYGDPVDPSIGIGAHTFGGYVGDVVFEEGSPRVVVVAQARSRTGELVGAFVARVQLRFIGEVLSATRLGPGAKLLVVDGQGIPVARTDGVSLAGAGTLRGKNRGVDLALGSAVEGSLVTAGTVVAYRNLSSYQSLRGVRWAILLEQPEREAFALARKTTRDTLLVGAIVLALALIIGAWLASRLTRPLRRLAARADAIAGAPVDEMPANQEPIVAAGELGVLARRFEEMAKRIGEREKLQIALARGDRLASVGTMSASVAHEINNPLTTVLGYARLLVEDKAQDHPDRAGLELIADEAERMKRIVGGLLDYARTEKPVVRGGHASMNDLADKTAILLAPQLQQARISLQFELAEVLPPVACDPHGLQQVLVNLVQNAIQAMPDGGKLTLATALCAGERACEITVTDEGSGIPAGDHAKIFDPFYTTKAAGSGTGLGLAVCKHLVSQCGGSIEASDAPAGRGARFRVVIPIEPT